jgi:Probable cobalt transporter subunit (CbtA).
MFRPYVERGLAAGAAGGLAFGLFVAVVGNPLVGHAEELGHAQEASGAHGGGGVVPGAVADLVSVGGGVLWGLLLGTVAFGVVYYFLEPAIPGTGATKRYVIAAAGFVTVSGAPWLVLPPQPAGVEAALPTGTRILWYGGMVVAGAAACMLAGYAYRRLTARGTGRRLAALAALACLALLAVPAAVAPTATAGDLPAAVTAAYRGFVVFGQATLWFVLASVHAWLGTPGSFPDAADRSVEEPVRAD